MLPYDSLAPDRRDRAEALIRRIFAADGALDTGAFLAVLDPGGTLRIGSQPALQGRAAIRPAIAGLFAGQRKGIEHRLLRAWGSSGMLVYEAEATFHLRDGRDVRLPYVNVLQVPAKGLATDYRIYIDLSPLGT